MPSVYILTCVLAPCLRHSQCAGSCYCAPPLPAPHRCQLCIPNSPNAFSRRLCYCIIQFIEKDSALALPIITSILRYWPKTNSHKEVLYINELEELLDVLDPTLFAVAMVPVFTRIAACVSSPHFQVAERALSLWNNPYIQSLISEHADTLLPILFVPLFRYTFQ